MMMKIEGRIRLDHDEIRQLIAEHISNCYGIQMTSEGVSLWPDADGYAPPKCCASIDVSAHTKVNGYPQTPPST
jgi:hypothetical protein